ncbi:MAG: DUF3995 domain-containing protein [Gemmatimonadaceae bacterium]|nr:DUF3995 domain-containing protein [Gemmatimonadaceae bacterium]
MTEAPLVLAVLLTTVLLGLALLHVYWAIAGVNAGTAIPTRADGTRIMRPGRLASLAVAGALAIAAALVAGRGWLTVPLVPMRVFHVGTMGVAAVFALRAIGDFRYVGLFKRVRGTPFARWDTWLFTPLCALLAATAFAIAFSAVNPPL